jgi:hypothetical protein
MTSCVSVKSHEPMDKLTAIYDLKDSVKEPERYLGANIRQWQCPDGRIVWAMDGKDYITNAVAIVKDMLAEDGLRLAMGKGTDRPMPRSYRPELDLTPELDDIKSNQYQQLIGIFCWAVEIGRVDIFLEVALLSTCLASPREGHLQAAFHIFAYLVIIFW